MTMTDLEGVKYRGAENWKAKALLFVQASVFRAAFRGDVLSITCRVEFRGGMMSLRYLSSYYVECIQAEAGGPDHAGGE